VSCGHSGFTRGLGLLFLSDQQYEGTLMTIGFYSYDHVPMPEPTYPEAVLLAGAAVVFARDSRTRSG
jgi:hypothetical protein